MLPPEDYFGHERLQHLRKTAPAVASLVVAVYHQPGRLTAYFAYDATDPPTVYRNLKRARELGFLKQRTERWYPIPLQR